jgi:hypothetical protein
MWTDRLHIKQTFFAEDKFVAYTFINATYALEFVAVITIQIAVRTEEVFAFLAVCIAILTSGFSATFAFSEVFGTGNTESLFA